MKCAGYFSLDVIFLSLVFTARYGDVTNNEISVPLCALDFALFEFHVTVSLIVALGGVPVGCKSSEIHLCDKCVHLGLSAIQPAGRNHEGSVHGLNPKGFNIIHITCHELATSICDKAGESR